MHMSCNVHITYNKQTEEKKSFCSWKSGQTCQIKSSHTCLVMYAQASVGFLCCVSSGSSIAIPLSWIGFVFDLKSYVIKIMSQM